MSQEDNISAKLAAMKWPYASQDPVAFAEIRQRVANAGKLGEILRYSELVKGIDFSIASVGGGKALRLGVPDWSDLHRAILGDFLGCLCMHTYEEGGFMGSSLVVSASEPPMPGEGYWELMRQLGVLSKKNELAYLEHWSGEVKKAYAWYASHP